MKDRLLDELAKRGYSGRGLAANLAKTTGYSRGSVSDYLNGKQPISDRFVRLVCAKFDIPEHLIFGTPAVPRSPANYIQRVVGYMQEMDEELQRDVCRMVEEKLLLWRLMRKGVANGCG